VTVIGLEAGEAETVNNDLDPANRYKVDRTIEAGLQTDDRHGRPGLLHRLMRLGELRILGAARCDHDPANRYKVDRTIEGASAADYDGLVVPGGCVGADKSRRTVG
jgi:putative intracellular protease/amidase